MVVASKIQARFGQAGQEGLRIDVGTFNQDFADGFIEAVGEWVNGGFGRQMNVVAIEQQVGGYVLQAAHRRTVPCRVSPSSWPFV